MPLDGWVRGTDEGYNDYRHIGAETEDGVATSIHIWMKQGAGYDGHSGDLYVGLIFPLSLNDNTYGANVAQDWLTSAKGAHKLKELEGSDKWLTGTHVGGTGFELLVEYGSAPDPGELTIGGADTSSLLMSANSLEFNKNWDGDDAGTAPDNDAFFVSDDPGLSPKITQVGGKDSFEAISSDPNVPLNYAFDDGVEWLGAIMYEIKISGEIEDLIGGGFVLTPDSFFADIFDGDPFTPTDTDDGSSKGSKSYEYTTSFHHSPNKLGDHLVKVPEPATYRLFGAGVLAAIIAHRRFRSKKSN
ncbi:MAG: hypothetical protein O3C43_19025 [Verrucomicrobia bacterium]|nr:hypothetical protein [Verrucomicrobiota bacterium]MDA1068582.1 hypothetical protein [Verrucomicrobiota bacterium]